MSGLFRWLYSPSLPLSRFGSSERPAPSTPYEPNVSDVLKVKQLILHISNLPLELIDLVIDHAEYWPHTTTPVLPKPVTAVAGRPYENRLIMRSFPLGYVPGEKALEYQLKSDADGEKQPYSFKEPVPWLENDEAPDDATEEVLQHWLSESRPRTEHPCRKIVFTFTSHDQGWGGEPGCQGTYRGAYSWFDVGLERLTATRDVESASSVLKEDDLIHIEDTEKRPIDCILRSLNPITIPNTQPNNSDESEQPKYRGKFKHPMNPSDMLLQKNLTATSRDQNYKIVWSADDHVLPDSPEADELEAQGRGKASASGEFVRNLKPGDVVTVWAKARFWGWANHVKSMKIDVYWAV